MEYQVKDLFQTQSELVEAKMQIAANNAIDRVVNKIEKLGEEIHDLNKRFDAVDARFAAIEVRLAAVETNLGMRDKIRGEVRNRAIEYLFKAGWLILASIGTGTLIYFRL